MRSAVSVVLALCLSALTGVLSRPPSAADPATLPPSVDQAKRWREHYSVASDGLVVSFVVLGDGEITASRIVTTERERRPPASTTPGNIPQTTDANSRDDTKGDTLTTWSIAWYLTLLAAFVVFFVFIGLMEICCRKRGRFPYCCGREPTNRGGRVGQGSVPGSTVVGDPVGGPPPPYDLFKPPSYNTLFPQAVATPLPGKKEAASPPPADHLVYVINVHGGRGVS